MSDLFTPLYRQFSQAVLKFLLKRSGGDQEAAEQVLQDTFVSAYKSLHTFKHKSSYFTWLCAIALRKLADYYRVQVNRRSRIVAPTFDQLSQLVSPQLSPEERLASKELSSQVNRCLDLLPPQYRRLLQLKYYDELSNREICVQLKLSPRKLEGRLYRAKKHLAKVILTDSDSQ